MPSLMEAPVEVEPASDYTAADAAWWALESARLADRRELEAHYAAVADREFDALAEDALARDLYQYGVLPC